MGVSVPFETRPLDFNILCDSSTFDWSQAYYYALKLDLQLAQTVNVFELNEHACAKKCNAAFQSFPEGNVVCQVERLVAWDRNIKKLVNSELLAPLFQIDYVGFNSLW